MTLTLGDTTSHQGNRNASSWKSTTTTARGKVSIEDRRIWKREDPKKQVVSARTKIRSTASVSPAVIQGLQNCTESTCSDRSKPHKERRKRTETGRTTNGDRRIDGIAKGLLTLLESIVRTRTVPKSTRAYLAHIFRHPLHPRGDDLSGWQLGHRSFESSVSRRSGLYGTPRPSIFYIHPSTYHVSLVPTHADIQGQSADLPSCIGY